MTRILLCAGCVWLLAVCPGQGAVDEAVLQAQAERVRVIAQARQTAVAIFSSAGDGGGSGVLITADGYALSNYHVTRGAGAGMKCGLADGRLYDAVIVGIDPVGDVALIKLFGRDDFPYAEMADSDLVRPGDWVFAVGNPFLLATDFQPTVTAGIVSGVRRYQYPSGTLLEYTDCIQTDASINPGNSGGPLFSSRGELIGINGRGSFEKRGRVNVGVGYAISINQVKNFLGCLHSGRIVDHATLGARVTGDADGRVLVADILEDSDAYRRGLRYGDEIVTFGGRPITTVNGFKNALGIFPKGWRVPLVYRREGRTYETFVRLAGVHSTEELITKVEGRPRVVPGPQPRRPEDPRQPEPDGEPLPRRQPLPDQPRPQEQEPPEKDQSPPGDLPEMPLEGRIQSAPPLAKVVREHLKTRRGYTNYYFNEIHRQRIWDALRARSDFTQTGTWHVSGALIPAGDARFDIADDWVTATLPGGQLKVDLGDDLTAAIDPPGSGGLFAALGLWRRMLVVGPEKFGDAWYYGTLPLPGHSDLVEAIVGTYGGVECQFLFDPSQGHLLAMEMSLRSDTDPCELRFADYAEQGGRWLPRRLEVRHNDQVYAAFRLDQWRFDVVNKP